MFPVLLSAQEDFTKQRQIGFNITHNSVDGMGASLRFKLKRLKFEINSNFNTSIISRVGYEFLNLRKGKFDLGLGVDLAYKRISRTNFGLTGYESINVELPLELKYSVTPRVSIMAGSSFRLYNLKENYSFQENQSSGEIRLGGGYKF